MATTRKLERCEICQGRGTIRGIFHVLECAGCNGGGLVTPEGVALEYPQLVAELRERLRVMSAPPKAVLGGAADDYQNNNKRGPGGSHRTLD